MANISKKKHIWSFLGHNNNGGNMKNIKIVLLTLILLCPFNVFAYSNYIIPGGENIGIEIVSDGIMVVGFYEIEGKYNKNSINVGDKILKIANEPVETIAELVSAIDKYQQNGKVKMLIESKGAQNEITFKLIKSGDLYKTGLYVKDSISGIGTLTYIDPETKIYGALGHEIIESNSNAKIEVKTGSIFKSSVSSIDRSVNGSPGTKNARFYANKVYGTIVKNTRHGIYGNYDNLLNKELVAVGQPEDLKLGKATISTVLNDETVNYYEINITKIDTKSDVKNIYFEITDKRLLDKTGGIVQGMSGSPILQDNKIYGAVTHVVVENVKRGYGIFITTMLEEGDKN